jgi:hypothetical protein
MFPVPGALGSGADRSRSREKMSGELDPSPIPVSINRRRAIPRASRTDQSAGARITIFELAVSAATEKGLGKRCFEPREEP